ncbi:MAG TPA: transporter substrate-binding domain-containing protein [Micropepsaceae bacterium]|nr:transporter substrate-binding domain-containing protein [Micropepsaceae bacterium]
MKFKDEGHRSSETGALGFGKKTVRFDSPMVEIRRRIVVAGLPVALAFGWCGVSSARAQTVLPLPPPGHDVVASLAPTGRLRAAINLGNAVLAQRDPKTGQVSGVIMDISNELARRLGTPVDFIFYDTGGKIAPGQAVDHWDIAFLGTEQSRAAQLAVTTPYLSLDGTYLVREDAPFQAVADLDRDGVRIATALNSAYDLELSRMLKHATLVRAATSAAAIELFEHEGLNAAAGVRQALMEAQRARPGLRVLPDAYTRIDQAMTIPRGREPGFRYLAQFVEYLKATGFVRNALDRSGQSAELVASGKTAP